VCLLSLSISLSLSLQCWDGTMQSLSYTPSLSLFLQSHQDSTVELQLVV
jgi:hypothetical protein